MTLRRNVKVMNPLGLHARPASIFVKIANKFESEIMVTKEDQTVNGKSIMGLLMLAAEQGSVVELSAEGRDAESALMELEKYLTQGIDPEKPGKSSNS
ncbi:MAG: HPr family phosphocarrier protein [Candidatus Omnitrophica bacterium]|nr:HPr family phosphocarrier protein [Candidatus Omnitrophota bacterium]